LNMNVVLISASFTIAFNVDSFLFK
jgi:hypothetical protein